MSGITLDWTAIRPLNGGREKGFEELCSQLARAEAPDGARFVRKGTPDAGVECYAVLADATEWGWQSKYFDAVGDSQWKQLDESVEAAIEKHPQLGRYYVCVPLDLADARIVGKKTGTQWKSAKDQWDEHVTKWRAWAQEKNRTIEFVWWGSSKMLERLARTENVGRVRFWFDKRGFDGAWFSARLDEAIRAAGPRYTPEIHVELPIAEDLDAFGRTQRFFNRIKALAIPVREALQRARYSEHSIADAETAAMTASLSEAVQTVLNALGAISQVAAGPLPFTSIVEKVEATSAPVQALAAHLEKRAEEHLYLDAVNARLAQQLGYDARTPLVRRAVDAFAAALVDANERWLQRERAAHVVDALLPNRDFERSLSRGLVVEGVLAEDSLLREGTTRHDVVYVAYERLADHVVAKALLDKVPAPPDWAAAFSADCVLAAVIADEYIPPGLLEALFIQVAERTDTELLTFAPQLAARWGTGHAVRQSLIWRSNAAFSEATRKVLNDLCGNDHDLHETLEVLLTVATVPEHPLNATFLDRRLRKDRMADRDAWWSTYLYSAWGGHGAVDRVVDWAWAIGNTVVIADDAVDLCGIALAWMLTTSHRFLRDRATKALVNLYTGRLAGMVRLVDRFADVDDPYIAERIYGVAYGVAMRSQLVAQDPTASAPGPSTLLLRADALQDLQQREQLTLCWAVLGEKRVLSAGGNGPHHPALRLSGAYVLDGGKLKGFVKRMLDEYDPGGPRLIDTYRSEP